MSSKKGWEIIRCSLRQPAPNFGLVYNLTEELESVAGETDSWAGQLGSLAGLIRQLQQQVTNLQTDIAQYDSKVPPPPRHCPATPYSTNPTNVVVKPF